MLYCVITLTSSQQYRYEAVISSSLEVQCAMDQPASSSTKIRPFAGPSNIPCAKNCASDSNCIYFNIHDDSGLCQLFYCTPSNVTIQPGCRLYKVSGTYLPNLSNENIIISSRDTIHRQWRNYMSVRSPQQNFVNGSPIIRLTFFGAMLLPSITVAATTVVTRLNIEQKLNIVLYYHLIVIITISTVPKI